MILISVFITFPSKVIARNLSSQKYVNTVALVKNKSQLAKKYKNGRNKYVYAAKLKGYLKHHEPIKARYFPKKSKLKKFNVTTTLAQILGLHHTYDPLSLHSSVALVINQASQKILFSKNSSTILPIASITKLMSAKVILDAAQDMDEILTIGINDRDTEKGSSSRLHTGMKLSRNDLLTLSLMASENRATFTLASNYPGGRQAFVDKMNSVARNLNMTDTHFTDPTGLNSSNVSSAADIAKLVNAAYENPIIRDLSTKLEHNVYTLNQHIRFVSTNRLVLNNIKNVGLQKTGFIKEAGRCLVVQMTVHAQPIVVVLLASIKIADRFADMKRIRALLERNFL